MTYKINGTDFTLQPETGQWLPREIVGLDGNGHPVYSSLRKFEIRWGYMSAAEFNQLQTFFSNLHITGSAVATLPQHGASTYQFYDYSGCVVPEPQFGIYFEEYVSDVYLIVTHIRT